MNTTHLKIACILFITATLAACSNSGSTETDNSNESTNTEENAEASAPEETAPEESPLGNFAGLVGSWTVDAATAGVKVDITFEENGTFKQNMGTLEGLGTWEVTGDETILIKTQHTDGQTWKLSDLTEGSVNVTWNPDKPEPKTIPFQRVD